MDHAKHNRWSGPKVRLILQLHANVRSCVHFFGVILRTAHQKNPAFVVDVTFILPRVYGKFWETAHTALILFRSRRLKKSISLEACSLQLITDPFFITIYSIRQTRERMEDSLHSCCKSQAPILTPDSPSNLTTSDQRPSSWRRLSTRSLHKLTDTTISSSTTASRPQPENSQQPLTVFAKLHIQPGYEQDFEQWYRDIAQLQRDYWPGYLSSELVKPMSALSNEYISIFRYDNYEHLEAWMTSAERHDMIIRAKAFSQAPPILSFHSLEYWFVPAQQQAGDEEEATVDGQASTASPQLPSSSSPPSQVFLPPPKYKMVAVTFLVIWSMLQWTGKAVQVVFGRGTLSKLGFQALSTFLTVLVTAYVAMPLYTAVLGFWLFPHQSYATSLHNGVMSLPWPIPKLTTVVIKKLQGKKTLHDNNVYSDDSSKGARHQHDCQMNEDKRQGEMATHAGEDMVCKTSTVDQEP